MQSRWNKQDEEFIRDNYLALSDQELASVLGRSLSALKKKKSHLHLVARNVKESNKYNELGLRLCTKCKGHYAVSEFFVRKYGSIDKLATWCKGCVRERCRRSDLKSQAFAKYGNICSCCGESHPLALTIDHINNDGNVHRKAISGSIYKWLFNNAYPEGFQVLCWTCNIMKYLNKGACPHKAEVK